MKNWEPHPRIRQKVGYRVNTKRLIVGALVVKLPDLSDIKLRVAN
jgi:hypothetical protein